MVLKRILLMMLPGIIFNQTIAQNNWPQEINLQSGGSVTIYQPQPEKLDGNKLTGRAAVSVKKTANTDPVFGAIWAEATLLTDKDSRKATMESIKITDTRFPSVENQDDVTKLKTILETELPKKNLEISLDDIVATLKQNSKAGSDDLKNDPPQIIYKDKATILVTIDGEPIVKKDDKLKLEKVINTPFLIVKSGSLYYLYGEKIWYQSKSIKEGWSVSPGIPAELKPLDEQIKKQEKEASSKTTETKSTETKTAAPAKTGPKDILVTTTPAELIQSDGKADFKQIEGTGLLFMSNTTNDIFMHIESQNYYVLLAGRWYKSTSLSGNWTYIASDALPADFAKIPEGNEKDGVLASVAGTQAAKEAVLDAEIPQTAKVDRKSAKCSVSYDGEPKFEAIQGTSLELASNASATVIKSGNKFYCVDNGIWFSASSAKGPWAVSEDRPKDVDKIPASSAAYNTKYVYIYDVTPTYIYTGYTPGYMGCYVYGPTVVYGTGFYYAPWYGVVYYPRPVTWGFGMSYNPWTGWSMGISNGFITFGVHFGYGGWWGPPMYHPYYRPPYGPHYGPRPVVINNNVIINNRNNIYNNRNNVVTHNNNFISGQTQHHLQNNANKNLSGTTRKEPGGNNNLSGQTRQNLSDNARKPNNAYADKDGNVFRNEGGDKWQQNNGGKWQDANQGKANEMNQERQNRDRAAQRNTNFQQNRGSFGGGGFGGGNFGGGGGGFRGGGGGRRR